MFCFPTLGSPWCCWVPLTIIAFKLTAQEKSQIQGVYSLQCSQKQNRSQPSRAEEHVPDLRNSAFSHLSPTPWQLGHPRERLQHHWPRLTTGLADMCHSHSTWPARSQNRFLQPPEQDGLGAGSPCKRGHLTLNLKPFCAYLVTTSLMGIWDKRLFPRCGGCGQASCPLCKVIQDVHPVCGSPSPTLLEEKVERTWPLADLRAGSTHSEAPHPLLCPWSIHSSHHSHSESWSKGAALGE